MSLTTNYPGVYIREAPSGVHTITGVATSITAFVGYTGRGAINEPKEIFSFADFERAFGPATSDSPLSQAVRHFYTNGGSDAFVVRVAAGAAKASVTLRDAVAAGNNVLEVTAASEGTWGNNLRLSVDYATASPASLFNLGVTELIDQNGQLVVGRTETFPNLSMDDQHPSYVESVVNAGSELVTVERDSGIAFNQAGVSTSGVLLLSGVNVMPPGYRVAYTLNGQGPYEVTIAAPTASGGTLAGGLNAIAADLQTAINANSAPGVAMSVVGGNQLRATATFDGTHLREHSSIHFLDASQNSATAGLKLGVAAGGTEADGASNRRPAQTGSITAGGTSGAANGAVTVKILNGASTVKDNINLPLWGGTTGRTGPGTLADTVGVLNASFTDTARTEILLQGASAMLAGGQVRIIPGGTDPDLTYEFSGGVAGTLNLDNANTTRNVARYAPGLGTTFAAQVQGTAGNNGTPPTTDAGITGSPAAKTGIYALDDVDLFNLMVIPDASTGSGRTGVLSEAIAYCERRRAFLIADLPFDRNTPAKASAWAANSAGPLRSRNAGLFFPTLKAPDPANSAVQGTYGAAGALAGLFARTDAERGVWKAPAGTNALIAGASGLSYKLTDAENGTLNPIGVNCLRTFPVIGTVNWGARTARGADAFADEYKYIPIRRLALFLEESLFRGTQWVVFEPNDEPLWSQIRLNLGAFMHDLFSRGAFQGKTPREAYFVRCDADTTTQNDIDLGRVNIVVGFAPLKPAEFVVITIQQIAGHLLT